MSDNLTRGAWVKWSQLSDLNRRPTVYKVGASPPLALKLQCESNVLALGTVCLGHGVRMQNFYDAFTAESFYSRKLKDASKRYRAETLTSIKRTWPALAEREVQTVTPMECLEWSGKLVYGATRFNSMIGLLKNLFTMAVKSGFIQANPADCIERIPVRIKPPKLPSYEKFHQIISYLETSPESRRAVRLVKFLAYSGLRIGEALKLTQSDITPYGIRVSDSKNGEDAFVPILPEMAELIKTLPAEGPLFRVKNPRKALQNACRAAGVAPLTNHQLRHLFATRCIECGVDIKTVAEWLRHKDGGALALKRYSHVRNEHSKAMAEKVRF